MIAEYDAIISDLFFLESNVVPTVQLRPDVNDEAWERIHKLSEQVIRGRGRYYMSP